MRNQPMSRAERREEKRRVQLEAAYNDHLFQLRDHFGSDQIFKHVIKNIVQMPLKCSQAWGIGRLSRKPDPLFDHAPVVATQFRLKVKKSMF